VLIEARAAGLTFDLVAAREGDKLPFHHESRVTLTAGAFRAATQTVTPQGVIAIARVADHFSISETEVHAALAYYHRNKAYVDARIALNRA